MGFIKYGTWSFTVCIAAPSDKNAVYTNMSNGESFLFNSSRTVNACSLSGITYIRLIVNKREISSNTGAKLTLKYSEVYSNNPADYIDIGVTPVEVHIDTENIILISNTTQIKAPQNDVYLAVIGSGGDGVISPEFGGILVELG